MPGIGPRRFVSAAAGYDTHVLADSPYAYWRLLDATLTNGATLADASGNGRTATITTGFAVASAIVTGDAQALDNTGVFGTGNATFGPFTFGANTDFTLEAWVMAPTVPVDYRFGAFGASGAAALWCNNGGSGNKLGLSFNGSNEVVNSPNAMVAGVRKHVAVTRIGTGASNITLYEGGASVATGTSNAALTLGFLAYGGQGGPQEIVISEAALYTTGLSAARILDHWTAGQ